MTWPAILYTSGTTGRSKGAMLTHGNLCSNAESLKQAWGFSADDVLLHALPIFHIHGLFVATNVALLAGAPHDLAAEVRHRRRCSRRCPQATVMMGVPTFYTRLLQDPRLHRETAAPYAAVHLRLGAAAGGNAPRMAGAHRPCASWNAMA